MPAPASLPRDCSPSAAASRLWLHGRRALACSRSAARPHACGGAAAAPAPAAPRPSRLLPLHRGLVPSAAPSQPRPDPASPRPWSCSPAPPPPPSGGRSSRARLPSDEASASEIEAAVLWTGGWRQQLRPTATRRKEFWPPDRLARGS